MSSACLFPSNLFLLSLSQPNTSLLGFLLSARQQWNSMTSIKDLENRCLPISKLMKYATEWMMKLLVIRHGLTKEYKNNNGEDIRWQLIFVDEEGTKLQTTLFNQDVHAWNKYFEVNQSYYIINRKLNGTKPNVLSMHKDYELAFITNTVVVEDKRQFNTKQFSNGSIAFEEAKKITNGTFFGILLYMFVECYIYKINLYLITHISFRYGMHIYVHNQSPGPNTTTKTTDWNIHKNIVHKEVLGLQDTDSPMERYSTQQ